jgi:hypothetical protein
MTGIKEIITEELAQVPKGKEREDIENSSSKKFLIKMQRMC